MTRSPIVQDALDIVLCTGENHCDECKILWPYIDSLEHIVSLVARGDDESIMDAIAKSRLLTDTSARGESRG